MPKRVADTWTNHDVVVLVKAHLKYKNKWKLYKHLFPLRNQYAIKNYYYCLLYTSDAADE